MKIKVNALLMMVGLLVLTSISSDIYAQCSYCDVPICEQRVCPKKWLPTRIARDKRKCCKCYPCCGA